MKLTKILILLLAFWLEPLSASPYFSFKKYQVEDGLSHNTVWCAIQIAMDLSGWAPVTTEPLRRSGQ